MGLMKRDFAVSEGWTLEPTRGFEGRLVQGTAAHSGPLWGAAPEWGQPNRSWSVRLERPVGLGLVMSLPQSSPRSAHGASSSLGPAQEEGRCSITVRSIFRIVAPLFLRPIFEQWNPAHARE